MELTYQQMKYLFFKGKQAEEFGLDFAEADNSFQVIVEELKTDSIDYEFLDDVDSSIEEAEMENEDLEDNETF